MKNKLLFAIMSFAFLASENALADNHSVSVGYAQSMVKDFTHIRGVNAQYRYEWDSPVSVIGSISYMTRSEDYTEEQIFTIREHAKMKYWSLLVGPSYRFSDYISAYVIGGFSHVKSSANVYFEDEHLNGSEISDNFAYGAGVIINPLENLVLNVGYEGTKTKFSSRNFDINGFNVGVGYRF